MFVHIPQVIPTVPQEWIRILTDNHTADTMRWCAGSIKPGH